MADNTLVQSVHEVVNFNFMVVEELEIFKIFCTKRFTYRH